MLKLIVSLVVAFFVSTGLSAEGFGANSRILTKWGVYEANMLARGMEVYCCTEEGKVVLSPIVNIRIVDEPLYYSLVIDGRKVYADGWQLFYCVNRDEWVRVCDLEEGKDYVVANFRKAALVAVIQEHQPYMLGLKEKIYIFTVKDHHTLYLEGGILCHNMDVVISPFLWVLGRRLLLCAGRSLLDSALRTVIQGILTNIIEGNVPPLTDEEKNERYLEECFEKEGPDGPYHQTFKNHPKAGKGSGQDPNNEPGQDPEDPENLNEPPNDTSQETIDDLISESERINRKSNNKKDRSVLYERNDSTVDDGPKDFNKFKDAEVFKEEPGLKLAKLKDGRILNFRLKSDDGRPTLEVYNPVTKQSIKFRYGIKISK